MTKYIDILELPDGEIHRLIGILVSAIRLNEEEGKFGLANDIRRRVETLEKELAERKAEREVTQGGRAR